MIHIPKLQPFIVPKNATIEKIKARLNMSPLCLANLTTANFGISEQIVGRPIEGGFLYIEENYSLVQAQEKVQQLAQQTGESFRFGTPLELLIYRRTELPLPPNFISLAKGWENLVLVQGYYIGVPRLDLRSCAETIPSKYDVFIVKDE